MDDEQAHVAEKGGIGCCDISVPRDEDEVEDYVDQGCRGGAEGHADCLFGKLFQSHVEVVEELEGGAHDDGRHYVESAGVFFSTHDKDHFRTQQEHGQDDEVESEDVVVGRLADSLKFALVDLFARPGAPGDVGRCAEHDRDHGAAVGEAVEGCVGGSAELFDHDPVGLVEDVFAQQVGDHGDADQQGVLALVPSDLSALVQDVDVDTEIDQEDRPVVADDAACQLVLHEEDQNEGDAGRQEGGAEGQGYVGLVPVVDPVFGLEQGQGRRNHGGDKEDVDIGHLHGEELCEKGGEELDDPPEDGRHDRAADRHGGQVAVQVFVVVSRPVDCGVHVHGRHDDDDARPGHKVAEFTVVVAAQQPGKDRCR